MKEFDWRLARSIINGREKASSSGRPIDETSKLSPRNNHNESQLMIGSLHPRPNAALRRLTSPRLLGTTMLYLPHHVLYKNTTNSKITV
jgi:hypothetical protein